MSVFDFCGTWIERRDGDSLEPLMRAMKVRESKIQESLSATPTQRIWVKGTSLVTAYNSEFGEVASTFALNGGWRVSTKKANSKQVISRCTYDSTKKILLIEKKLIRQGGILRDERRVEREDSGNVIIRQRLEFIPLPEEKIIPAPVEPLQTVVANRTWGKVERGFADAVLDRIRGVWVLDEDASESLRPIFEAMNLPSGSIRSALAMRTQHSIFVSGPKELLLVNQSLHGDLKSAIHPVQEWRDEDLEFPEKGKMMCYAVNAYCVALLSTSEDGSSSNKDERVVAQDLLTFDQRITFCQAGKDPVVVNRRWKRAPNHTVPWTDTLPVFRPKSTPRTPGTTQRFASPPPTALSPITPAPMSADSMLPSPILPPTTPRTIRTDSRLPPTSPSKTPAARPHTVMTDVVRMQSISSPATPKRGSVASNAPNQGDNGAAGAPIQAGSPPPLSQSLVSIPANRQSQTKRVVGEWSISPFLIAAVTLLICTVARFFVTDTLILAVGLPIYTLLRSSAGSSSNNDAPSQPLSPWTRTSLLLLVATLTLYFPSKGPSTTLGSEAGDSLVFLVTLCMFGLSRFFSPSRVTVIRSKQDQWLAIAIAGFVATAMLTYGIPKLVAGEDDLEPELGPITILPLLGYGWLRLYAFSGPPQDPENEDDLNASTTNCVAFEAGVETYRISENGGFAEYLVYVRFPDNRKFTSWQRYSSFREFRKELGRLDIDFPEKRVFGNKSAVVLESRLKALDAFIKQVFAENGVEKFLETSHSVRMFVGAPAQ